MLFPFPAAGGGNHYRCKNRFLSTRGDMKNTVRVSCEAAIKLKLEDLTPLQGNLKALTEANFEKLKRSILRHGVSSPFFCWQHDGVNYILDGTQRDRVLSKMVQEGY